MRNAIVELENVTKRFGSTTALDGVSIGIESSEIFGLVGPNGAGKTTTIRILLGFIRPDTGAVRLFDSRRPFPSVFRFVGYCSSEGEYYRHVPARRLFALASDLRGDGSYLEACRLAERLGLDFSIPIGKLSSGNRQKVGLVLCLMGGPKLLIMDEPASGLDPLAQHELLQLILELKSRGTTMFISSHQLYDIQNICDRICLIDAGRVREICTIAEIRRRFSSTIIVTLERPLPEAIIHDPGIAVRAVAARSYELVTQDIARAIEQLVPAHIVDLEVRKASLEHYFRQALGNAEERTQ